MHKKIPYNKEIKKNSGKQIGRGGPRDSQRRQATSFERGAAKIQLPPIDMKELRKLLLDQGKEEGPIDLSGIGLTYTEAKEKIQRAVEATRVEERKKYESRLRDLNDQLDAAKVKMSVMEETLVITPNVEYQVKEKNVEINELKMDLIRIETELKIKEELLDKFTINYASTMEELRSGILELSGKLSEGQVSNLIKAIERPEIQDDVFIDPIEGEDRLDPHIKIKVDDTSAEGADRNVKDDLAKLKILLGKQDG